MHNIKLLTRALMMGVLIFSTTTFATDKSPMSNPIVKLTTNQGDIVIELNAESAPNTVKNFIAYVEDGFYTGTIFHRVIPGFMVQGGGFDAEYAQKDTKDPVENEADNGLSNDRGFNTGYTLKCQANG